MMLIPAEKLSSFSEKDIQKQARVICDNITGPEKGPPSQKRIQLLHYIVAVSSCRELSNALVKLCTLAGYDDSRLRL